MKFLRHHPEDSSDSCCLLRNVGVTAFAVVLPTETNQRNSQIRREKKKLRRIVRHDRRDWRRYRPTGSSNGGISGYRPLRPVYAYEYGYKEGARNYHPSGFNVQMDFGLESITLLMALWAYRGQPQKLIHQRRITPHGLELASVMGWEESIQPFTEHESNLKI